MGSTVFKSTVFKSALVMACGVLFGCAPVGLQVDEAEQEKEKQQVKIVSDPMAPAGLRGFLRMAQAYSVVTRNLGGNSPDLRSFKFLIDGLNDDTAIETSFAPEVPYSDPRMMKLAIIVPQTRPEEADLEPLARYLMKGGFILGIVPGTPIHMEDYIEALERFGGLVEGRDMYAENLPDDHPLYKVFYDIDGGRPLDVNPAKRQTRGESLSVRGFFVKGRLVALNCWLPYIKDEITQEVEFSPRHLKMGINMVLYALIQEGSLAQQLSLGN